MSAAMAGQKRLVITGATGMVGGYALRYALEDPAARGVTSIGRRKLGISHPKLMEVLLPVFRALFPNQVVRADDLARVMVDAAVRGTPEGGGTTFENRDIRAMIGSLRDASRKTPAT